MFRNSASAVSCVELLKEYENSKSPSDAKKLIFYGVGQADVYNISAPFIDDGKIVIAGRVEERGSEISKVRFFEKSGEVWNVSYPEKTFNRLQDPFFTRINNELVLGGVQVDTDPLDDEKIICWRTLFYRGKNIRDLTLFAAGPNRMKDIRLVGLKNGKIGVFTRPQGGFAGMGKIGYCCINSLDELNEENILGAKIFNSHFIEGEWGGVNEPHLLKNGLVGILGHIAYWEHQSVRHYFSMSFAFNPDTQEHTPVRIIARRSDFPEGNYKRLDLQDVLFSGGLIRRENGRAELYTGVADSEAHVIEIDDPFIEYEK